MNPARAPAPPVAEAGAVPPEDPRRAADPTSPIGGRTRDEPQALELVGLPPWPPGARRWHPDDLPACGQRPLGMPGGERLAGPPDATRPFTTRDLARLAMDYAAGVGDIAASWMLGDDADALDPSVPGHLHAWTSCVAAAAFALAPGSDRSPYRSWCRDDPRPDAARRQRAIAVLLTPMLPWRLDAREGEAWRVSPLLPVSPGWIPDAPVDLRELGWLVRPPLPGDVMLARLVPSVAGIVPVSPVLLRAPPPPGSLTAWFGRLAGPLRASNPGLRREDVYRRAGHHLIALAWGMDDGAG